MPDRFGPAFALKKKMPGGPSMRYVTVPWELADLLQTRLAERGLRTTLTYVLWEREARLEPAPGMDADYVAMHLTDLFPFHDWKLGGLSLDTPS
jgi:hypothetical protein